jgi:hypothetical protein
MKTSRAGLCAAALLVLLSAATSAAGATPGLVVTVDHAAVVTKLGHTFVIHSTISNNTETPAKNLIAHLNVLSLRNDVYVDPEDWSSHRTRYLPPIPARGATTLTWKLNAVNAGHLAVYVAVLPQDAATAPTTGPTVAVRITDRRTLNSGGILPLALGLPAGLGLLALLLRLGRRRATARAGHEGVSASIR